VHCPDAQVRELPHDVPSGAVVSAGQVAAVPLQTSWGSQIPVLVRHTVPFEANWQVEVQQSSLLGSQTACDLNLQVVGSQHGLLPHPGTPPQSQSSPASTIPFPHWLPVIVEMSLFAVRQVVLTLFLPIAEKCCRWCKERTFECWIQYLDS